MWVWNSAYGWTATESPPIEGAVQRLQNEPDVLLFEVLFISVLLPKLILLIYMETSTPLVWGQGRS
jgi:hypothetical protein